MTTSNKRFQIIPQNKTTAPRRSSLPTATASCTNPTQLHAIQFYLFSTTNPSLGTQRPHQLLPSPRPISFRHYHEAIDHTAFFSIGYSHSFKVRAQRGETLTSHPKPRYSSSTVLNLGRCSVQQRFCSVCSIAYLKVRLFMSL